MTVSDQTRHELRRELLEGDAEAIVDLHERIYKAEYGMDDRFVEGVRRSVERSVARGWPRGGGVWLVGGTDSELAGCLGLTHEGDGLGRIRWVLLAPEARGLGLGRRMVAEAVEEARRLGLERLELDTFGALRAAAAIYRSLGFEMVSAEETEMWGPPITYQHYELQLDRP